MVAMICPFLAFLNIEKKQYILNHILKIYAEVEIPVASNRRPVVDKTLVASNLSR
jgi:hypothetical protein